jgi:hypothetical protein
MLWVGYPKDEPQTTNGVEAFHRHFIQQFYTPHPHIHQVISVVMYYTKNKNYILLIIIIPWPVFISGIFPTISNFYKSACEKFAMSWSQNYEKVEVLRPYELSSTM